MSAADDIPAAYILRLAQVESGGNPLAVAKTSTAAGLFQFTVGTWDGLRRDHPELRLSSGGRLDPVQAERAVRFFTAGNAAQLLAALGREAAFSELYLAHFLGIGDAIKVLKAPSTTPCTAILRPAVCRANEFVAGLTAGGLRAWARKKVPDVLSVSLPAKREETADDLNARELSKLRPVPKA